MLFERRCPGCEQLDRLICRSCRAALGGIGPCPPPPGANGVCSLTAAVVYDRHSARLILAAKNGGRLDVLRALADLIPLDHLVSGDLDPGVDVVTWVPASRRGRRHRGYDQGQVIANRLARRLGLRAVRLLIRRSPRAQGGRSRSERLAGPGLAVATPGLVERRRRGAGRVLLVDDVVTTGGSLAAAARALTGAGATAIHGAALAAVEPPGPGDRL